MVFATAAGLVTLGAMLLTVHATVHAAGERLVAPAEKIEGRHRRQRRRALLHAAFQRGARAGAPFVRSGRRRGAPRLQTGRREDVRLDQRPRLQRALHPAAPAWRGDPLRQRQRRSRCHGARKSSKSAGSIAKGARYFFVVGRASKTGTVETNRALSHRRANSIQFFIKDKFADPELESGSAFLWLGNEFAQLDKDFCDWPTSRGNEKCDDRVDQPQRLRLMGRLSSLTLLRSLSPTQEREPCVASWAHLLRARAALSFRALVRAHGVRF